MSSFPRIISVCVLCLAVILPAAAQSALTQALQPATPTSSTSTPVDPLGRTTPSSSVHGFLQAAQSGDYTIAAQYLQMSPARRLSDGEQIASQLKVVLDR